MGFREERDRMKQLRVDELSHWAQNQFHFATSGPPQDMVVAEATKRWGIASNDAREYAKIVKSKFRRS